MGPAVVVIAVVAAVIVAEMAHNEESSPPRGTHRHPNDSSTLQVCLESEQTIKQKRNFPHQAIGIFRTILLKYTTFST
jgi:hypothetical protein